MPDNITVASVQQYKANVELLLQQTGSLLSDKVTVGSYVGKKASVVEQFGEATPVERTSRHGDTPLLDLSQAKRWVSPKDYEWGSLVDNQDQLRAIVELTSPYAMAAAAGMNRKKDDIIVAAFFGTSLTGEEGTTSETWDTAYQVGVDVGGTASSINAAKYKAAIRLLIAANKQELTESVYGAIGSYENDALLKEVEVINRDYNGGAAVLEQGKVKRFMGIDLTITERLSVASGNRELPVWLKSGMHLGVWKDFVAKISERNDKGHATQVYVCMTMGACRTQLGKTIKVLADDQI